MADLDAIFKAYDIRGTTPDQLDADVARAVGEAFAVFVAGQAGGARRVLVGPRHAPVGRGAGGGLRRRRARPGPRRRRPRPRLHRPRVLRGRQARRARRDVHRLAQPGPVQRHEAVPGRAPARSARTAASPRSRRWRRAACRPHDGPAGGLESLDLLRAFADHVRSFIDVARPAPAQGGGRHRQRHGRPRGARGVRRPARSTSRCSTASSTAPSRTIRPTRSSRRTCATSRRGCSRWAPTSAWPSTATPTGCSSSTRPARRCRAPPPRRSSRPACSTSTPAPRSSTTASARRRCPRSCASAAARRCAPRSGTASSRR